MPGGKRWLIEWAGVGVLIVSLLLLFAPMVSYMVVQSYDYGQHIQYAQQWFETGQLSNRVPHFLYHLLLIVTQVFIPGGDFPTAARVVGTAFYVLLGVLLYVLIRPLLKGWRTLVATGVSVGLTLCLMLVAPINIPGWASGDLYFGYIGIHAYHNPTMVVLKPLALLLFLCVLRIFDRDFTLAASPSETVNPASEEGMAQRVHKNPPSKRNSLLFILVTGVVGVLATLAKPSYTICLVPALVIFVALKVRRKQFVNWRLLMLGAFLPLLGVLAYQYWFHAPSGVGGLALAPFQVMLYYSPQNLPLKFFLSILFPLATFFIYFPEASQNTSFNLAWLVFIWGILYTYLAIEPQEWGSGNYIWSGQIALFVLFVTVTLFWLRQVVNRRFTRGFYVCALLLALHLASGIVWYLYQFNNSW